MSGLPVYVLSGGQCDKRQLVAVRAQTAGYPTALLATDPLLLLGCVQGAPEPFPVTKEVNFNVLQALTYWAVMYMVLPTTIVTGLIYLYPQFSPTEMFGMDGLLPVAMLHYLSAAVILMFAIAHIYLGTMGATVTSMFKTMITGWHESH